MPPNDPSSEGASANELACTSCRNRKLKCDRIKPACTRCARIKSECFYPESRRKPAFRRRNVRELEARLAQVEGLLKQNGDSIPAEGKPDEVFDFDFADFAPTTEDVFLQGMDYTIPSAPLGGDPSNPMFSMPQMNASSMPFSPADGSQPTAGASYGGELLGLGISESLPPFEVSEELNQIFFERQQQFIPIIHPVRYLQAYYSPPHMKPPMSLQYAIWALASNGNEKYSQVHDIFYQRARQYAEADELKGHGEHFITLQHAQAWSLIATDEAKSMLFTRAAMSSARSVRLAHMMGLHRLDGSPDDVSPPTLLPPKDWAELEERRRTFWGIFCLDSHCSVSTGWPHLIDGAEVTTHLPASETAFVNGEAVETCRLDEAFKGPSYSSFAGAILVCHLFNQILKHVHRPKSDDNPQNYEYGQYWQRHRDIDNTISSAFMFMPEHFRLPEHYRDSTAVHTNLNYHASLICLHLAALDKIDMHKLPDYAKKTSEGRLFTAAQEIINIIKMTSHLKTNPKSPMAAISLYCAASVCVYQCKESQSPMNIDNLNFIITAMEAIGREHLITRAFLKQLLLDLERNNVTEIARVPRLDSMPDAITVGNHNIPLLTRNQFSRQYGMQPPLPGRLPLGKPQGTINEVKMRDCGIGFGARINDNGKASQSADAYTRTRDSPSSSGAAGSVLCEGSHDQSPIQGLNEMTSSLSSNSTPPDTTQSQNQSTAPDSFASFQRSPWAGLTRGFTNKLPVRTESPATTPAGPVPPVPMAPPTGVNTSSAIPSPAAADPHGVCPGVVLSSTPNWNPPGVCMYTAMANEAVIAGGAAADLWNIDGQSANVDWNTLASSTGINIADFPNDLNMHPGEIGSAGGTNPG